VPIATLILVIATGTLLYFRAPVVKARVNHLSYRAKINTEFLLNIKHKAIKTEKSLVPYETIYRDDPLMNMGETFDALSTGRDGERTIVFEVTYRGEKEVARKEVSNGVTKQPEPHIVYEGTKPEPEYYTEYVPTYINSFDEYIPKPTQKPYSSYTPTAICNDGSYSYSANASGTCSKHGGVSSWY